ncbi:MAG TPA: calcium-binding protein, partial [Tepidisphaeraceae bacterium]
MRRHVLRNGVFSTIQPLERRMLLAFAELSAQGTLLVSGTDAANQITVTSSGAHVIAAMDGASLQFPLASVKRVTVDAGAGDDNVEIHAAPPSSLLGRDGNDKLFGGAGNDTIDGGAGDDVLNGEGGDDTLISGEGNDIIEYADRGSSFLFWIGPVDSSGAKELPAVSVLSEDRGEADFVRDFPESIGGSNFADDFKITSGPPYVMTLLGRGGNDLFERSGDQQLVEYGGPGNDTFQGYYGGGTVGPFYPPTLLGGPGNDTFYLSLRNPALVDGGVGGDAIVPAEDAAGLRLKIDLADFTSVENVRGAIGGQLIIGTSAANSLTAADYALGTPATLLGNGGSDTITGSAGVDSLSGGDGDDIISGGGGNDTIYGGAGNDVINGNSGNDRIYGGVGNDTLLGSSGRDRLYGEAGDDL